MTNLIQKWLMLAVIIALLCVSSASFATTFTISGVESNDIKSNIQIYLNDVNLPVSQYDVDDYQAKLVKQTNKALQAFGFYNAVIDIEPIEYQSKGSLNANINITLNKVSIVERIVMQSDLLSVKNLPPILYEIVEKVNKMQGKPIDHGQYESLKNQLSTYALLYGFFDFKFILHKFLISANNTDTASSAIVHWIFNFGERYQFGDLVFINDSRGQELATNVKTFNKGDYFDQTKIGEYSLNMGSTRYFSSAIARANAANAVNKQVPIEVILQAKPKDLFKFGIGVSTDTGPRASIDWTRPWVNLRGHSLGANLYVSERSQILSLNYRVPKDNPLKDFLNYSVGVKSISDNDSQTKSDKVSFGVQRQWGAKQELDWDKIGFVKLEQESFIQGLQDEITTRLLMPGVTISRTRKRGDIFVDWGDRQQITIEGASKSVFSDIDLFKITARTKWIREFGKHRVVLRGDVGLIATNSYEQLPSSQRFFAGGDQSIRGFGLNAVSDIQKVEVDGELVDERLGGKFLSVASVEYAYAVAEKWRVAAFIDAGSASEKFGQNIAKGIGGGVQWLSPIGNVEIYIARGSADFLDNQWRLHLVIGPGL